MTKFKKSAVSILALLSAVCITSSVALYGFDGAQKGAASGAGTISKFNGSIDTGEEEVFDTNSVYKLPETVDKDEYISLIIKTDSKSVIDAYRAKDTDMTVSEYAATTEASRIARTSAIENSSLKRKLASSGIEYTEGENYDTILSGFEITVKAEDFGAVQKVIGSDATVIVGEEYEPAETEVVTNDVDVYETGIFDSSGLDYQGDGVVIAVLDTGLDYTHTAFSVDNFTTSEEAFTLASVSSVVGKTEAASFTPGLTGEDVYVSRKVPYAYDYADKDSDVFPINSEHGTHVAGVIAGKDSEITGVAPNAQLAIMKVFSDEEEGAKTSWLLAALEDCVTLGVDVINMSLGSSCGFSREVDETEVNTIYDSIKEAGISLIAAASNDYNATFSSEKNGSNPLTTNPDSGTVGSPSTYDSALSVASVDGVMTPYIMYGDEIIYFNEASTSDTETKDFVDDVLNAVDPSGNLQSHEFEYVAVSGIGRSSDYTYPDKYYKGKIVLVRRGTNTFEEKVRVALQEKGAAGIIIYNNVSGTISMSVGEDINMGGVCSISQDEGEMLAAQGTGIIKVSRDQVAGPFMSDFSSWGPTSDLKIKPEITAHGGEIYSAVPGQGYDRLSGTSMAAPNQAGATALIRQYVKFGGVFGTDLTNQEITAIVNQLMMSTADIIYNRNGLPYSVRKQGSGLVNIADAAASETYITTYDDAGQAMDKSKIEFGDDKERTGVYTATFDINNFGDSSYTYDIGALIMTEGVDTTYTSHGDRTSSQDGYLLEGGQITVDSVSGGTYDGNTVTVGANGTAKVTVTITLSQEDKQYIEDNFAHGMYVEGFITFNYDEETQKTDMNVPFLAFYGDWTEAPIFDEEYYDTNVDEIDNGIDPEDKLMADAYATRVIGGLYDDYIRTLGTYAFVQDPASTQIAASKEHIAISNQGGETSSAVNSIQYVRAGLLRNAKEVDILIVENSTGNVAYEDVVYNQRKSYSSGGTVYYSSIDLDYSAIERNLKNNTQYTVTLTAYVDYGDKAEQNNVRNTFTFPLYIDFEAPALTDVTFRTETDRTTNKTSYYADLSIYDNHYAMAVRLGQVTYEEDGDDAGFFLNTFGKYPTPVYSSFNSTSTVTIELTDYIEQIKQSDSMNYYPDGSGDLNENNNSFIAICYDYAMNTAMYEVEIPDEFLAMAFSQQTVTLNPNETMDISKILSYHPMDSWIQTIDFQSSNPEVADIINQTVIAKASGDTVITATGYDADGKPVSASVNIHVLGPGEEGYNGNYTRPEVNNFTLTTYTVNKAYYSISSSEMEIGYEGGTYDFGGEFTLSMFPSESVTLDYVLDSYYPERTSVLYSVGNSRVATVSADGTIVAQGEGTTIVTANVQFDGKSTLYSSRVSITVKDPFTTNSIYLMSYKGLGGKVEIPDDRGITTIYAYAFSGYDLVPKDLSAGDVINEEDPYYSKQQYIGEDTITEIIIPEGVTDIQMYAFAGLTSLEKVVLPSTLNRIGVGAFYGCTKLKEINLENVQFINKEAFRNTALENVLLNSVSAIGTYAFADSRIGYLKLPVSCQSLGAGAFYNNAYLDAVDISASRIKIGSYVFAECPRLTSIDINASVIPSYAFYNSTGLTSVTLGRDVSVIGEYAFAGTAVSQFKLNYANTYLTLGENGAMVYSASTGELLLVAPNYGSVGKALTIEADTIAAGAFAGNTRITSVIAPNATYVGAYAFADCKNLRIVTMPNVEEIGEYAFANTAISQTPDLTHTTVIGAYAFAYTQLTDVTIAAQTEIGEYAFAYCNSLESVTVGDGAVIGAYAFYSPVYLFTYEATGNMDVLENTNYYTPYIYSFTNPADGSTVNYAYYSYNFSAGVVSSLENVVLGSNVTVGNYAFAGNAKLATLQLGNGANIGAYAFYNAEALGEVDLSQVVSIGDAAFSGSRTQDYWLNGNTWMYAFVYKTVDGQLVATDYKYTAHAPRIAEVDLSSVSSLGSSVFAFNEALTSVTLGSNITKLPEYTFAYCASLEDVVLPANITEIHQFAFYNTSLASVNLENITSIGASAFAGTELESVSLDNCASVGDSAFENAYNLAEVAHLNTITAIGNYAFAGTALTSADLSGAKTIGDYAFAESAIISVTFGTATTLEDGTVTVASSLESLGENPFYGCDIATFGIVMDELFGEQVVGSSVVETYTVGNNVRVIDGVLYQSVPNGLELVCYPMGKQNISYTVEDGTVRVSARAFYGVKSLRTVTLPLTLAAIGDKAFYGCSDLYMVVFRSYDAPILEEEYDESYAVSLENLPFEGYFSGYEGLGIIKYYMWNITSEMSDFYYGANFVDYIGHISSPIVMVKPANGNGYDTFIFEQYFSEVVNGSNAATAQTLAVIDMINALPANINLTLADAPLVEAARAAYDAIPSVEQQALVTNYRVLLDAEETIEYLKPEPETPPETDTPGEPGSAEQFFKDNMWGLIIAGVLLLAVIGLTVYIVIQKKNNKHNA